MTTAKVVKAAFAFELLRAELAPVKGQVSIERAVRKAVLAWLQSILPAIEEWALAELQRRTAVVPTIATPAEPAFAGTSFTIAIELPKSDPVAKSDPLHLDPDELFELLLKPIQRAFELGASNAAAMTSIDVPPPAQAVAFAHQRSAELVGKTWVEGILVDNPNAELAITDTVREDVRAAVEKALVEGWSPQELAASLREQFGHSRAETIARTEVAFAQGHGSAASFEDAGISYVQILDGEGCLPEGHFDGAPLPSGTPGVVEDDCQANGQIWTLGQYEARVIGHPNCTRGAAPWVRDAEVAA